MAECAQRIQCLHRLRQHGRLQQRRSDVGRIDQRHLQRGDDLLRGQLLRMHMAVEVYVGVRDQQLLAERRTAAGEDGRQTRPPHTAVVCDHLPQHAGQLTQHLLGAGEPPARIRIDCAAQQAAERVVLVVAPDRPREARRRNGPAGPQLQCQRRQRAADGVDVAGHRRTGPHDLRRLVTRRAVQIAERVDPRHRAEVDQLQLLLGDHDVFRLEVVVDQADRMQIAQRGKNFQHVRDRFRDGQLVALAPLERLPTDVLHDDVADGFAVLIGVLDEVEDLHDRGMDHLGEELPLGHRDRLRLGVAGMHQTLEHDRPVVDVVVDGQIHPAQPAVRDATLDLVLPGDHCHPD